MQTKWSKRYDNWEAYIGKIFYDPGTKDDPDLPDYEAGEFKVSSVTKENNFTCNRLGSDIYDDFDIGYVMGRSGPSHSIRVVELIWKKST